MAFLLKGCGGGQAEGRPVCWVCRDARGVPAMWPLEADTLPVLEEDEVCVGCRCRTTGQGDFPWPAAREPSGWMTRPG